MIDACTRCGKCVEVCPATEPAGLSAEQLQNPAEVIRGVIDLLRGSAGRAVLRKDAQIVGLQPHRGLLQVADCRDLVEQHGLGVEATRQAIKAMLDEQPVPLRGGT